MMILRCCLARGGTDRLGTTGHPGVAIFEGFR